MTLKTTTATAPVHAEFIPYTPLPYGFQWGAAKVTRLFDDQAKGSVTIGLDTPKQSLQVYVTKTGKIRIHDDDGEWVRASKD